ncbi:MAG: hypothetical protein QXK63_02710 [Thermoproteus sp.]
MEYNEAELKKALLEAPHVAEAAGKAYVLAVDARREGGDILFAYPAVRRHRRQARRGARRPSKSNGGDVVWEIYRLSTNWSEYALYCESPHCDGLAALAKAVDERAELKEGRYVLKTAAGKAFFYSLWRKALYSLSIDAEVKQPEGAPWAYALRVEVLDVKPNGDVCFRLWYYRWFETRPAAPYVDFWIRYRGRQFRGHINVNGYRGIYEAHLVHIRNLARRLVDEELGEGEAVGVYLAPSRRALEFYGTFRDAVLKRVGYSPEPASAEPASIKYLGGMRFKVEDRVVEFGVKRKGVGAEPYAKIRFGKAEDAINFYRRLRAAGIYVEVVGSEVRLDYESYWGMVAATNTVVEGVERLYPWAHDRYRGLYVFKEVRRGGIYYHFAFRQGDVWRAVGGKYGARRLKLVHADRSVLEAFRQRLLEAYEALGVEVEVAEAAGLSGKDLYYIVLSPSGLRPFEERGAPIGMAISDAKVEGPLIVVRLKGAEHRIEFKPLRGSEFLLIKGGAPLYRALKARGVAAELRPDGVRLGREGMWGLLASIVDDSLRRGEAPQLPPGVELPLADPKRRLYVFGYRAEGGRYRRFVMFHNGLWREVGGKTVGGKLQLWHSDGGFLEGLRAALGGLLRERGVGGEVGPVRAYGNKYCLNLYGPDLRALGL